VIVRAVEMQPSRPPKGDRAPDVDVLATAGSGTEVLDTVESAPTPAEPRAGLDVTAGEHGREPHARALDETLPGRAQPLPLHLDETRQSGPTPAARGRGGLETTDASLPGSSRWAMLDEPLPRRIGRFAVLRRLGRGGMGTVYAGFDEQLARRVALKVLHAAGYRGTDGRAHLVAEAQAMARLSHPNVVQVHELDASGDEVVLVMEYVEGRTLGAWLEEGGRDWPAIVRQLMAAGRGLAAAHQAGLVHRDFKPESRRPSQTAPQPTDRPHSHSQGRFERVDVYPAAPGCSGVAQVLAKRWQRPGPPEDGRGPAHRAPQPCMKST